MDNRNYIAVPLETERLTLQKGSIEDYENIFEYDFRFLRNLGGIFEYKKLPQGYIRDWYPDGIESSHLKNEQEHKFDYIIYLKDGTPIGHIDAHNENECMSNSIEISYNLHPNFWGNGYIPEATKKLMEYLFEIGYENIILGYEATNEDANYKSKRVIEKLGFEFLEEEPPFFHKALGIDVKSIKMFMNKEMFKNKNINSKII